MRYCLKSSPSSLSPPWRAVWGVAQTVLLGLGGNGFTMQMFIAGAFATALPGIVLQLVLIPVVMVGLEHAGVLRDTV